MTIELTNMPILEVIIKSMRPMALKNVPTVEPRRLLLLKNRLRTNPIVADPVKKDTRLFNIRKMEKILFNTCDAAYFKHG